MHLATSRRVFANVSSSLARDCPCAIRLLRLIPNCYNVCAIGSVCGSPDRLRAVREHVLRGFPRIEGFASRNSCRDGDWRGLRPRPTEAPLRLVIQDCRADPWRKRQMSEAGWAGARRRNFGLSALRTADWRPSVLPSLDFHLPRALTLAGAGQFVILRTFPVSQRSSPAP